MNVFTEMPDKPLTVLTYAASASLAAIAVVYWIQPNALFDGSLLSSSARSAKKKTIGLINPANDCFINSVLQTLAGLSILRTYLVRETHKRDVDDTGIYSKLPKQVAGDPQASASKMLHLQQAYVTRALREMIDRLLERAQSRKSISAAPFIRSLEMAFETNISKTQQDAQELLQIIAERLEEEYVAGEKARRRAAAAKRDSGEEITQEASADDENMNVILGENSGTGFPWAGQTKARIECTSCGFVPKANPSNFIMLNLMVPHQSSSSLNECLDSHFKTEIIDDYRCDKCRLMHAVETTKAEITRARSDEARENLLKIMSRLETAINVDPENPPEDIQLPRVETAPKRQVARHVELTCFPQILVLHLSRSIFDSGGSMSTKNTAKVTFPAQLPMGSLLNRRNYRLSGVITHKGTHQSGHYEAMRRQECRPFMHSPATHDASKKFTSSKSSSIELDDVRDSSTEINRHKDQKRTHGIKERSRSTTKSDHALGRTRRPKKDDEKWWRISDEKVTECLTNDVLDMKKEVYMLFYELDGV